MSEPSYCTTVLVPVCRGVHNEAKCYALGRAQASRIQLGPAVLRLNIFEQFEKKKLIMHPGQQCVRDWMEVV